MTQPAPFSCLLIGHEYLAAECGRMLLDAGHDIRAVVTRHGDVRDWAEEAGLTVFATLGELTKAAPRADWVISAANLEILNDEVLALGEKGAINFHDGPLPRYAGLNAPVWALLNGEARHGITWHRIAAGIDTGEIIATRDFEISEGDTALTLNARCFSAGIEAFPDVITALAGDLQDTRAQDASQRSYFGMHARPRAAGLIDPAQSAHDIQRLVRALDHGAYWNPLSMPKLLIGDQTVLVGTATPVEGEAAPGEILAVAKDGLTLGTATGCLKLSRLTDVMGAPLVPALVPGDRITAPRDLEARDAALALLAPGEKRWKKRFVTYRPALWCEPTGMRGMRAERITGDAALLTRAFVASVAALAGPEPIDIALADAEALPGLALPWRPVRFDPAQPWGTAIAGFEAALAEASTGPGIAADLPARLPDLSQHALPDAAISDAGPLAGAALTLERGADGVTLHADLARLSEDELALIAARLSHLADSLPDVADDATLSALPLIPDSEKTLVLETWNATEADFEASCIHRFFEAQVDQTPDATALVFEDQSLTYAELDARANRVAHVLQSLGVAPGTPVGLHVRRGPALLIGALGILKAGGAYLPLDPAYPADRIALFVEDSGTGVILSETALTLETGAEVIALDGDPRLADAPENRPESPVSETDLAYMIYTSGSTGRPKGVMIEHRNVANFFTGMDQRIAHGEGATLLAVTSLSFDISVLELFWTLARGFKIVLSGEDKIVAGAEAPAPTTGAMDFSLFYWGNDDGVGRDKYGLLLEGAKFADKNGFTAIWTPERHFHAFGGLYPNPSVTGAAVAAVTENIGVRAGSCVTPLHHPARIAEEWAVIDNLTNGRAGLAVASGWQPDDFVLRPENAPPNNKTAMFDTVDTLRKLWAGEAVEFEKADGTTVPRLTQPRPVSKKLPLWVTTAGNPDTWRQAGEVGANVLTHLLGQTVEEVGEKIKIYHEALRKAGHDPKDFAVTLMLHTFLAGDRETARDIAREPMKNYLRSAADLIKQYAWAFPAFKKPVGTDSARDLDLGGLEAEELEAILDFAFERYFERSGLFGTTEDAMARVEEVRAIGVTEVACLIDYGIDREVVLDGLRPLADVVKAANTGTKQGDYSLAGAIEAHGVTHLQCTPYMARMLVTNEASRAALARIDHMMVGGEPLSAGLIADLEAASGAKIENMYGPTETTIWSTTATVNGTKGAVSIGTPIANTHIYVLDEAMQPVPVGAPGELYIAGAGVARGYWGREDLTAERFLPDPFRPGNAMFRTGDLVRWQADGTLTFLGRADAQVKLRGYRIEPGEIEALLEEAPGVTQAVVIVREDATGVGQLFGYVTGEAEESALKSRLQGRLPAFMVPNRIVTLETMPLTPNKKVDRKALPTPGAKPRVSAEPVPQPKAEAPKEAPAVARADLAPAITAIWAEFLNLDGISGEDNFFDLGGHSLLAVEMHRAVRDRLGLKRLSIADVFRAPTLKGFIARAEAMAEPDAIRPAKASPAAPGAPAPAPAKAATPAQAMGNDAASISERRKALRKNRTLH